MWPIFKMAPVGTAKNDTNGVTRRDLFQRLSIVTREPKYKLKLYFTWKLWKESKCQKMHWSLHHQQKKISYWAEQKEESTSQVEIGGGTQTPTRKILAIDIERSRTSTACWQDPEKRRIFWRITQGGGLTAGGGQRRLVLKQHLLGNKGRQRKRWFGLEVKHKKAFHVFRF